MNTIRLVRFRFLAALAIVLGSAISVWATTWPGYEYKRDGCYNYGSVYWVCINYSGTSFQKVSETVMTQGLNLYCMMMAPGDLGYPAEMQEFNCTAQVYFEIWYCPLYGPIYDSGYEEAVTRNIPNGRDVNYCQDPG